MRCMKHTTLLLTGLLCAPLSAVADGNKLYLLQNTPTQGNAEGNQIEVDQSNSLYSELGSEEKPLVQEGLSNAAKIMVEGMGSQIALAQTAQNFLGNQGVILAYNGANARLEQTGTENSGIIGLSGVNLDGTLIQEGSQLTGTLVAVGDNATVSLTQTGTDLYGRLEVEAYNSYVRYKMEGNGLYNPGAPLRIYTFNRDISVTQRNLWGNGNGNGNGNIGNGNGNGNNGNGNGNNGNTGGNNGNGNGNGNGS